MDSRARLVQPIEEEMNTVHKLEMELGQLRLELRSTQSDIEDLRKEISRLRLVLEVEGSHILSSSQEGNSGSVGWVPIWNMDEPKRAGAQQIRVISRQEDGESAVSRLKQTRVARFYMTHLKRYYVMRQLVRWMWATLYPFYTNHISGFLHNRQGKRWRPIIRLANFVRGNDISEHELACAEDVAISQPMVYPADRRDCLGSFTDQYLFPRIYAATIPDAKVYGGTNLILMDKAVVCHDLYDFSHDYTSEELHGRTLHDPVGGRVRWLSHDDVPERIQACATFIDACAVNYAHWLTEVLPRIALFCGDSRFKGIPVVVNEGLHANIMESLFAVAGEEREIVVLPIGRALEVEKLYVTSVTGYVPFEPRRGVRTRRLRRGEFSPFAMTELRHRINALWQKEAEEVWPERIYLRRNALSRRLSNAAELEDLLISRGFVVVEPERLTFRQQAQLFTNAKVVVGATGAAFVNALFCQPGAQVAILVAENKELVYEYWVNMLMPIGIRMSYILGKSRQNEIHSDFEVEPTHLAEFLDDLDKGQ